MSEIPLRKYQRKRETNQKLDAVQIKQVSKRRDGGAELIPTDDALSTFVVDSDFIADWKPAAPGFYAVFKAIGDDRTLQEFAEFLLKEDFDQEFRTDNT